jgi:hypothetical protein
MISLVEKIMGSLDLEAVTRDVMSKLVISKLEMYFVVHQLPGSDRYDLLGMTYSEGAARKVAGENRKLHPRIIKFNMGKLLKIVEDMGAIEEV